MILSLFPGIPLLSENLRLIKVWWRRLALYAGLPISATGKCRSAGKRYKFIFEVESSLAYHATCSTSILPTKGQFDLVVRRSHYTH